jgi:hypothetical protein
MHEPDTNMSITGDETEVKRNCANIQLFNYLTTLVIFELRFVISHRLYSIIYI